MAATDKLAGTCSVCLRMMQLHGDRPIRHGFSAVGIRHGQSGGYHTGPCAGTQFPHLGISAEGTVWALDRERRFLERTEKALADLATNPDLTWYPKKYDVRGGRPDLSKPVVVKYGDERQLSIEGGAPSYVSLHQSKKAALDNQRHATERAIDAYEKVLATWSPEKYPVTGAAKKIETCHMATPRKNVRGEWTGVQCRFTKPGYASDKLPKSDDPSKITCKRCRSALGMPPS